MNKICTDIEQSQKLVEFGVDINSADMHYVRQKTDYMGNPVDGKWSEPKYGNTNSKHAIYFVQNFSSYETLSAWSLSSLLGLMPFQIIKNNKRFGFYQVKGFNKQGETYRFGYKTNDNSFLFETSWHNDTIDTAFEMICWLKENGKL